MRRVKNTDTVDGATCAFKGVLDMRQRWNLDGEQGVLIEIKLFALQLQWQNGKVRVLPQPYPAVGSVQPRGSRPPGQALSGLTFREWMILSSIHSWRLSAATYGTPSGKGPRRSPRAGRFYAGHACCGEAPTFPQVLPLLLHHLASLKPPRMSW